jgi:hypothetical protein
MSDEAFKTLGLFDAAPAAADPDLERQPAIDLWPTVTIAGMRVDFREPSAPRLAAGAIFALGSDARPAAFDLVPANFRGFVSDLVDRADYNASRERALAGG